jgi:hypothetical protein
VQDLIEAFLRSVYSSALAHPEFSTGAVSLWTMPSKMSRHLPLKDLPSVAWNAAELDGQGSDVYYGVALRKPGLPAHQRGTKADLLAAPALWLDVDTVSPYHAATNLPKTKEDVISLLADLGPAPSQMISSGYGYHVYWFFPEPMPLRTPEEVARFEQLLLGLQQCAKSLAAKRGWHLDITADATRVLRLPGTYNRKAA